MTTARMLTLLSTACLLCLAGCATDQVEYVDEQGNVLAQDEAGQPIAPDAPRTATGPVDPMDPSIRVGDVFDAPSGELPAQRTAARRLRTQRKAPAKTAARGRVFPVAAPAGSDPLGTPPTGNAPPAASPAYGANAAPRAPAPVISVEPASSSAGLGTPPTQR